MPAMGDAKVQMVVSKDAVAYANDRELVATLPEALAASEPSICAYPENYYPLLQASFRAIEALRAGDSETVKMLTEAKACETFPKDLKTAAQKALATIPR